jgi:cobalt-zinc-cadmium efflux system protein
MAHNHDHSTDNVRIAFVLNVAFTIIEIIGGIYTNSLAILSDALHDLGDSLSLGMAWYLQKVSSRGRTKTFSYGYKRFSLLGAIINAVILLVGSIFVLSKAIPEIFSPSETDAQGMMALAVLGVLVNGAAVWRLQKGKSMNERVVSLHLLEDVLGWVAVLIGSIVMYYFDAPYIDPLLSVGISLFVLYNAVKNLMKSVKIVLQAVPDEIDVTVIENDLKGIHEIVSIHDCHIWSLDGTYTVMTVHAVLNSDYSLSEQLELKKLMHSILRKRDVDHLTVEFEIEGQHCDYNENQV